MTDNTTLDAANANSTLSLGEALSAARTSKKLSQQDVSNHLRFSVKQVDALENNQFDALPDAMITRGFIRNYARYLGLDAEPLLESYRAQVPTKSPSAMSVKSTMHQVMPGKDSQPWLKYILGSILVLLFLLAWIFYIDYMPKNAKPTNNTAPETIAPNAPTEVPLPEIALPAAEREAGDEVIPGNDPVAPAPTSDARAANVTPVPATPGVEVSQAANSLPTSSNAAVNPVLPVAGKSLVGNGPASKNSAIVQIAAPAAKPAVTTQTAVASPAVSSAKPITLSVTEKTWINVKDKSGKVVYEKILPAGSADTVDGEPPFYLVIGNAKATTLAYKGQSINLASNMTENNVARIKLE